VRFAEVLNPDGSLYTTNLRNARATDYYTFKGTGEEVWEPQFTFHGFRYVELTGYPGKATRDLITGIVLHSDLAQTGDFASSDPLVNQLQHNILWGQKGNFVDVPTDCPQRDERLGWTGDIGIFAPTALFVADVGNFLEKWLIDLEDAQEPSGAYRDFAPVLARAGAGNAAWADAGVHIPWAIYESSGDPGVLDRQYGSMRRFLVYLEGDQTDGLRNAGRYGDWVSLGKRTPKDLIGTAYLARTASVFVQIARTLGHDGDAERFEALAATASKAFQAAFVHDDGSVHGDTQTGYAIALGFGLVPSDLKSRSVDRLAELVRAAGTHLATGFVGTPLLLPALSEHGQHELACELMRQEGFPGWVYEVRQGATTIWERWDGWTPEKGFTDPRMNSFNHYAFGSVGDWLHRYLAGLTPVEPGYRRTAVRPQPAMGFTSARASHVSRYGRHAVDWELVGNRLTVKVEVAPNTSSDVVLPAGAAGIEVDGRHVSSGRGTGYEMIPISLASGAHVIRCTCSTPS